MYHLYGQGDKKTEYCFNIETSKPLSDRELNVLKQLLADGFILDSVRANSEYINDERVIELGPRLNFATAFSTNAVAICRSCGLDSITRIERSRRYQLPEKVEVDSFIKENHDRMTEFQYQHKLSSFETGLVPEPVFIVPLIEQGPDALKKINQQMGLGMDDWDIKYYYDLFVNKIGRNPTNVECFQLGQANSEHSRHWFFKGKLVIAGQDMPQSLME